MKRNSGCRSPIGARVLPESHSSWYLVKLSCLRPSARALFSQKQYVLHAVVINCGHDAIIGGWDGSYTLQNMATHAKQTQPRVMLWPRMYVGAWEESYMNVATNPLEQEADGKHTGRRWKWGSDWTYPQLATAS